MSQDIVVPQMGESITEGVLAAWMVSNGAYVNEGDPIFELETDKVTTEVPSPCSGIITQKVEEGAAVDIGALVAEIDSDAAAPATTASSTADSASSTAPSTRKLMSEKGIDPASVQATGKHGTITKSDVLNSGTAAASPAASAASVAPTDQSSGVHRKRMSTLRQRIATRLVQAQHTAAILSTFNEIDMYNCMNLRKRLKDDFEEKHGVRLGFMSFFTKACTEALKAYPLINAQIEGTDVVTYDHVNVSVAVGTDKGLVVPVLRNADQMSFADVEREIRVVAKKARDGQLTIDDMSGGTFTITNGGVYGSLLSTPILNPPQSGILGMHSIQDRPVAINGEVVIRPMMYIALSYDHRIVDGSEAVGFLVHIKKLIEDPERMLLGL